MRFLVCGLGSMGRRRIRCLLALGYNPTDIVGYDLRRDRIDLAVKEYDINILYVLSDLDSYLGSRGANKYDAMIISVPPDVHHFYIDIAVKHHVPAFVEASVVDTGLAKAIVDSKRENVLVVPSSTMRFHPAIKMIKEIVDSGELGVISNVIYHFGQWLPDWHDYESPADYYVSKPETGAAREMVPFEMTWIAWVFGFPMAHQSLYGKTVKIPGAEKITDTYNILLEWYNKVGVLIIDVVSRRAIRRLVVNGEYKQLVWDWDNKSKTIEIYDPETKTIEDRPYSSSKAAPGYNPNIGEQMYVDELSNFIDAVNGMGEPANNLVDDLTILGFLKSVEGGMRHG